MGYSLVVRDGASPGPQRQDRRVCRADTEPGSPGAWFRPEPGQGRWSGTNRASLSYGHGREPIRGFHMFRPFHISKAAAVDPENGNDRPKRRCRRPEHNPGSVEHRPVILIIAVFTVSTYLGAGVLLGLSAGFSPGPLLTLVVTQTLKYGTREGVKVALAPLLTDLPIILACFLFLRSFSHSQTILGCISLIGGAFVIYLAVDNFRTGPLSAEFSAEAPRSLGRGVWVNFLSPHPYLFWMTVGAPLMVKAWTLTPLASVSFAAGFYSCLVGAKVLLALLSGKCRTFVSGRLHTILLRLLGILMLAFAGLLIHEGFRSLVGTF